LQNRNILRIYGKSTLVRRLLARVPELRFSVSYTTRAPRRGERDGEHYHFVDAGRFEAMIAAGEFLEWAEVHGQRYGTGLRASDEVLQAGLDLLLDIDIQGARTVRRGPLPVVSVMVLPPDFATLERRLSGRGSESVSERGGRLAQARREVEEHGSFDYVVINDDLERAAEQIRAVLLAERRRSARCSAEVAAILETFPA